MHVVIVFQRVDQLHDLFRRLVIHRNHGLRTPDKFRLARFAELLFQRLGHIPQCFHRGDNLVAVLRRAHIIRPGLDRRFHHRVFARGWRFEFDLPDMVEHERDRARFRQRPA